MYYHALSPTTCVLQPLSIRIILGRLWSIPPKIPCSRSRDEQIYSCYFGTDTIGRYRMTLALVECIDLPFSFSFSKPATILGVHFVCILSHPTCRWAYKCLGVV